jgi:hypothetical protein
VLNTALNVGVPVAVWVRDAALADNARQQIEQFLAGVMRYNWPQITRSAHCN